MNTTNRVQLTGNLGKDPEIKTLENGQKLAKFSMATKEEFTNKNGERSSNTTWHFIIAWGKLAERAAELQKGSFVSIDGRISSNNYTDKNGQKKYVTEIVANDIVVNNRAA
jgi:single-strand DNA-binding protein